MPPADLLPALRAGYGLAADTVTRLALGYDTNASVYRVEADGRAYFLKVRRDAVNAAGLAVPAYLHAQGLAEILAPLPTLTGALWHTHGSHALILYPFLDDAAPLASGAAAAHWQRFGALLRQMHTTALSPALAQLLQRDAFEPIGVAPVAALDASRDDARHGDSLAQSVVAAWRDHAVDIAALVERATTLGRHLRAAPPAPLRLVHADPHWDNILVDAHDRLWLVDWDDTLLAAPERDLMFVIGGISDDWPTPRDTALFMEGYGPAAVDPVALAYYRADWALQDLSSFAAQALDAAQWDAATRRDAARLFHGLFAPGAIVRKALGSEVPPPDPPQVR